MIYVRKCPSLFLANQPHASHRDCWFNKPQIHIGLENLQVCWCKGAITLIISVVLTRVHDDQLTNYVVSSSSPPSYFSLLVTMFPLWPTPSLSFDCMLVFTYDSRASKPRWDEPRPFAYRHSYWCFGPRAAAHYEGNICQVVPKYWQGQSWSLVSGTTLAMARIVPRKNVVSWDDSSSLRSTRHRYIVVLIPYNIYE